MKSAVKLGSSKFYSWAKGKLLFQNKLLFRNITKQMVKLFTIVDVKIYMYQINNQTSLLNIFHNKN